MKTTLRLLLTIGFCLFSVTFLSAQTLTLQKGSKAKSFKPDKWLNIYQAIPSHDCCPGANYERFYGKLVSVSTDSIRLEVFEETLSIFTEEDHREKIRNHEKEGSIYTKTLAKKDIDMISKSYKPKRVKRRGNWNVFGTILISLGAVTAGNSFIDEKGESRDRLLIVGGAQVGAGILLASFTAGKRYYISNMMRDDYQQDKLVWVIK